MPAAQRITAERAVLAALLSRPALNLSRIVHHARGALDRDAMLRYGPLAAREAIAAGAHRRPWNTCASFSTSRQGSARRTKPTSGVARRRELHRRCALRGRPSRLSAARSRLRTGGDTNALGTSLRWLSRISWWAGDPEGAGSAAEQAQAVLEGVGDPDLLAMAISTRPSCTPSRAATTQRPRLAEQGLAMPDSHRRPARTCSTTSDSPACASASPARWQPCASLAVALAADEPEHACRAFTSTSSGTNWRSSISRPPSLTSATASRSPSAPSSHLRPLPPAHPRHAPLRHRPLGRSPPGRRLRGRFAAHSVCRADPHRPPRRPALRGRPSRPTPGGVGHRGGYRRARASASGRLPSLSARRRSRRRAGAGRGGGARHTTSRGNRDPAVRAELGYWRRRLTPAVALDDADDLGAEPHWLLTRGRWHDAEAVWTRAGSASRPPWRAATARDRRSAVGAGRLRCDGCPGLGQVRARVAASCVEPPECPNPFRHPAQPAGLTTRQWEVAQLLIHGMTNPEIARHLVVSVRTVDTHVAAILAKVGALNRRELLARATDFGWRERGTLGAQNPPMIAARVGPAVGAMARRSRRADRRDVTPASRPARRPGGVCRAGAGDSG